MDGIGEKISVESMNSSNVGSYLLLKPMRNRVRDEG